MVTMTTPFAGIAFTVVKPTVMMPVAPLVVDDREMDMPVNVAVVSCGKARLPEMVSSVADCASTVVSASRTPRVPVVALGGRRTPLSVRVRAVPPVVTNPPAGLVAATVMVVESRLWTVKTVPVANPVPEMAVGLRV